jgi:predicted DNA-binding transcriptional regulator AlpA
MGLRAGRSFVDVLEDILAGQQVLTRQVAQLRAEISVLQKRPDELVDMKQAAAVLGIAEKTLRNRVSAGEFPRPDQLITNDGRKRRGWLMKSVLEHKLCE